MTQTPKLENITDESIMEIAHGFDMWLVEQGGKHKPTPIQMTSIILGRLLVFANHTKCLDTFQELMAEILNMTEPEPIMNKTSDLT